MTMPSTGNRMGLIAQEPEIRRPLAHPNCRVSSIFGACWRIPIYYVYVSVYILIYIIINIIIYMYTICLYIYIYLFIHSVYALFYVYLTPVGYCFFLALPSMAFRLPHLFGNELQQVSERWIHKPSSVKENVSKGHSSRLALAASI